MFRHILGPKRTSLCVEDELDLGHCMIISNELHQLYEAALCAHADNFIVVDVDGATPYLCGPIFCLDLRRSNQVVACLHDSFYNFLSHSNFT